MRTGLRGRGLCPVGIWGVKGHKDEEPGKEQRIMMWQQSLVTFTRTGEDKGLSGVD